MANGGTPPQEPPPGGYPPPQGGQQYPQQPGQYPQQPGQPPPGGGYGYGPVAPWGAPLSSWGKRVGAALIDGLVITVPSVIIMLAFGFGAFASADCVTDTITGITTCEDASGIVTTFLLSYVVIFVLGIAYYVYFNGSERGQTVGKMALKIQVRDEQTGGPIGYGKS